ncbi:hypothetical protein HMPREF9374_3232 [Desmospora sp. 8437]|nr:hypothetical protein HMPREF9374_3232 [Desmospora sp. 8437]
MLFSSGLLLKGRDTCFGFDIILIEYDQFVRGGLEAKNGKTAAKHGSELTK